MERLQSKLQNLRKSRPQFTHDVCTRHKKFQSSCFCAIIEYFLGIFVIFAIVILASEIQLRISIKFTEQDIRNRRPSGDLPKKIFLLKKPACVEKAGFIFFYLSESLRLHKGLQVARLQLYLHALSVQIRQMSWISIFQKLLQLKQSKRNFDFAICLSCVKGSTSFPSRYNRREH